MRLRALLPCLSTFSSSLFPERGSPSARILPAFSSYHSNPARLCIYSKQGYLERLITTGQVCLGDNDMESQERVGRERSVNNNCRACTVAWKHFFPPRDTGVGTSVVVPWLRVGLLMQGVRFWSLIGERRSHPHASWPKNQDMTQKQYCNQFNKD